LDARTDARTDTQVILYSVQCYALHWAGIIECADTVNV